jgi:hypothetical protein
MYSNQIFRIPVVVLVTDLISSHCRCVYIIDRISLINAEV